MRKQPVNNIKDIRFTPSQLSETEKELLLNEAQALFGNAIKAMDEFSSELKKLVDSWQRTKT